MALPVAVRPADGLEATITDNPFILAFQHTMNISDQHITAIRPAGNEHQVVTVIGEKGSRQTYRRTPCPDCPWCVDATGVFPALAFEHSANTAHDMSPHQFGCHQSGTDKPATCAGFLLRGAEHNLAVRLARIKGEVKDDVTDGGRKLHASYRAMAIANGVPEDSESLKQCR